MRAKPVATLSLIVVFLMSSTWLGGAAQSNQQHSHMGHRMPKGPVPQRLDCGLWRTDHTFQATLRIKNELLTAPLTVTPVLFMADGTEYDLPPVTIAPADVNIVNINDALRAAPASVQRHLSEFGSALLRYEHEWNAISGSLQDIDAPRSLIYRYAFRHFMPAESGHQVIEGLWWKHDAGVDAFVALSNTTPSPLRVHVAASNSHGHAGRDRTIAVLGHATELIKLSELHNEETDDQRGGITISYEGDLGGLLLSGGLENAAEGFSAPMVFRVARKAKSDEGSRKANSDEAASSYASVGIMVGNPDPMMGFPGRTKFTPYTILRNGDSEPITVQPRLFYMMGMETIEAAVQKLTLLPHETVSLDISTLLGGVGVMDYNGNVNFQFSYNGNRGALLIATGSVDQTGSYVFDVTAAGIDRDRGKRVSYWENQGVLIPCLPCGIRMRPRKTYWPRSISVEELISCPFISTPSAPPCSTSQSWSWNRNPMLTGNFFRPVLRWEVP